MHNDQMLTTAATMMHNHNTARKGECCKECAFEREKRAVTQTAFERALGISLYLMKEIEKLSFG